MVKFEVSDDQQTKIDTWLKDIVYPAVIKSQKKLLESADKDSPFNGFRSAYEFCWGQGVPYEGTISGRLTYHFTNTSVGLVLKVNYGSYELDLTDYDNW